LIDGRNGKRKAPPKGEAQEGKGRAFIL